MAHAVKVLNIVHRLLNMRQKVRHNSDRSLSSVVVKQKPLGAMLSGAVVYRVALLMGVSAVGSTLEAAYELLESAGQRADFPIAQVRAGAK
jgi:hypothetical protein